MGVNSASMSLDSGRSIMQSVVIVIQVLSHKRTGPHNIIIIILNIIHVVIFR